MYQTWYVPHLSQREIHEALRPWCRGAIIMVIAGRRFGKTVCAINEIAKRAVETEGARIWYIAPTKEQAFMIAWRLMLYPRYHKGVKFDPYLPEDVITKIREDKHYVELVNGSLIEFKGCQDEVFLLGAGLHFVVLDEFPTIPWTVWYDTIKPMLSDYNGDALMTGTVPDPKVHYITKEFVELYEALLMRPTENEKAFNFTSFKNPHINQQKIKTDIADLVKRGREGDAKRLYFGKYTREFGKVFSVFNYGSHTVEPFEINKAWTRIQAVDPHSNKAIVAVWAAIDPRGHTWIYREKEFTYPDGRPMTVYEAGHEITEIETAAKEKVSARLIDPTFAKQEQRIIGAKSVQTMFRECGLHFREADRTFMPFYNSLNDMLVSLPDPTFLILRSCPRCIEQIDGMMWDSWASAKARLEKGAKDKPRDVNNDFSDCIKYIVNAHYRPINKEAISNARAALMQRWESGQFM